MQRIPEPEELMDETTQARAYAEADFSASNHLFMERFESLHPGEFKGRAIDLGCGPADIALRFLRRYPQARVEAVDGANAMLQLARQAACGAGLESRIRFHCLHLPTSSLPQQQYQAVLSNSLLHHLHDPLDLWRTIRHCGAAGSAVLVMDLLRPADDAAVQALVQQYAADAPLVLKTDFRRSLYAAYSLEEIHQQLAQSGLTNFNVEQISDRHLAVSGYLVPSPDC